MPFLCKICSFVVQKATSGIYVSSKFLQSGLGWLVPCVISLSIACVASVSVGFSGKELLCEKRKGRGRGRGRKETLAVEPLDFENLPLFLSCLTDFMLSSSIQAAFVILVLARFEIFDHCIFLSWESYKVTLVARGVFLYFRDEAAIMSGKATHQSQRVWILSKHFYCK